MYDHARRFFKGLAPRPWSFDGHGLNRDGERIAKMSESGVLPTHLEGMKRNPEFDAIGEGLAEFCNAIANGVSLLPHQSKEKPPILFEIDEEEIEECSSHVRVVAIVVKRKNGKEARFHVALSSNHQRNTVISCEVSSQGRKEGQETRKSVAGKFADWS